MESEGWLKGECLSALGVFFGSSCIHLNIDIDIVHFHREPKRTNIKPTISDLQTHMYTLSDTYFYILSHLHKHTRVVLLVVAVGRQVLQTWLLRVKVQDDVIPSGDLEDDDRMNLFLMRR